MAEPEALGACLSGIKRTLSRMATWQQSAEGMAYLEHARQEILAKRIREQKETADTRGIVPDGDVRVHAFRPDLDGAYIRAIVEAVEWRRDRSRMSGERQPALIVLSGPRGRGKTVALSWKVMHEDRSAWYVTASQITTTIRNGHSDPEALWRRWERCSVLAIDDVELEDKPDILSGLLLTRWSQGGLTLLASNLSRRDFGARYLSGPSGERLLDRIEHVQKRHGLKWCVVDSGPSLRQTAEAPRRKR